jgi:phenylalanyl-tRNA synthetase alpha chain
VTALLKTLGGMAPDERPWRDPRSTACARRAGGAGRAQGGALRAETGRELAAERQDMSLPVRAAPGGHGAPGEPGDGRAGEIFADLGFAVADGPEIEDDWHNFTALNIPPSHPARAMHDTVLRLGPVGERWFSHRTRRRCRSAP